MSQKTAKYRKDYQAPAFTIEQVDLTFELDPQQTRVTNTMVVTRQGTHDEPLVLDGEALTLISLTLDGDPVSADDYSVTDQQLTLNTDKSRFTLTVVNDINPSENKALEGLYLAQNTYCTQCEAEGFRRITYYLDRPDVLAKFTTTVIADKQQYPFLLSNGNLIKRDQQGDKHIAVWQDPFPKPSYLFALVAGDFDVLRDTFTTCEGRTVELELFVDKGNLDRAEHAMTSLKNAMRWDEQRFGLVYDLDIYMIVAVDFFNMGAMENKGLNVFNAKYVLANPATATDQDFLNVESVIGHEYFHNWTGNRITCRDWFQLSLKEGLTVFRDQEFSSDLGSRAVNRIQDVKVIRSHQFTEDAGPMAHPIRPDKVLEMNNFYTVTVYNKGAEVIRMIHSLLGEAGFQKGMKLYVERHDGQAVTCEDFVTAMEDANGVDFTQFRNWYAQAGTPQVKADVAYDRAKQQVRLTLRQHTPATPGQDHKDPFHIPVKVSALAPSGAVIELSESLLELTEKEQTFVLNGDFANKLAADEQPVLSLFDDFSAPVKVERDIRQQDLLVLMAHAPDPVSRWDASQQLFASLIHRAIAAQTTVKLDDDTVAACGALLQSDSDPALIALALTLPNAATLADSYDEIPVEQLRHNLQQLKRQLAAALAEPMQARYDELTEQLRSHSYQLEGRDIAMRQLRNTLLLYLAEVNTEADWFVEQYQLTDNMTDTLAVLQATAWTQHPAAEDLLQRFDQRWQGEKLVMDKWFQTQALADHERTVERVQQLMQHSDFSIDNPNRVYSLLAAFTQNLAQFHRADGAGYRLVGEVIERLNNSNPQVASRLLSAFMSWKRYDPARQALMKQQLEQLQALPKLASDLQEKVENSLSA
ncbi:aminopeptidase N [Idiomarina sp. OT37-5b]|uniref:aminopeptidase N n=1 Tax=Idiomarina sp. OT37-5b TaxID=2100422 RepID=UPI000CF9FBE3|nr:aminopeptidase N [Idiomarina sp. OT37-5b]AVJ55927.1 aminopeptidase N [Idiomarina sp. OT37-5b]